MISPNDCNIQQGGIGIPQVKDKWYCSISATGSDGDPVVRYLGLNSTWNRIAYWFDTEDQIKNLLALAEQPDFTLSDYDLESREMMRDDMARDIDERFDEERLSCYDDLYDDPSMP